jgi:hypothetical protein
MMKDNNNRSHHACQQIRLSIILVVALLAILAAVVEFFNLYSETSPGAIRDGSFTISKTTMDTNSSSRNSNTSINLRLVSWLVSLLSDWPAVLNNLVDYFRLFPGQIQVPSGTDRSKTHHANPNPPVKKIKSKHKTKAKPSGFYVLNPENFRHYLRGGGSSSNNDGDDDDSNYDWAVHHIPFVDFHQSSRCNCSDDMHDLMTAYYYRWKSYRKHIVYVNDINNDNLSNEHDNGSRNNNNIHITDYVGYVVTEFLPNVPWAGHYNTIPAAAGHHIQEGRWIHDQTIIDDYIKFWIYYEDSNPSSYTNWIGYAAYQRFLLNGDWDFIESLMDGMVDLFRNTYVSKYLRNITLMVNVNNNDTNDATTRNHCWYQNDGYDAMEVSISGNGCRPTIASVMYGEAEVIVALAQATQNKEVETEFRYWMELSRSIVLDLHWNPQINSFAVIPLEDEGRSSKNDNSKRNNGPSHDHSNKLECDLASVRIPNRPVNIRELLAFMPWYFDSLISSTTSRQDHDEYMKMWKQLFDDEGGFAAPYGLRTAEYRHQCYNYSWDHGDCWNGPSWPYETSRILTSLANILNQDNRSSSSSSSSIDNLSGMEAADDNSNMHGDAEFRLTNDHYWQLLWQYTKQHTRTFAVNDTATPIGSGHVFENVHPDLGYWNNREIMYRRNDTNRDMGDDYNHSTFCDLILNGLLGIRPQRDGTLNINPLIPSFITKFAVDHVLIQGDNILSVTWNRDDSSSTRQDQRDDDYPHGLTVRLNGQVVAHRPDMGLLKIHLLHGKI